MTRFEPTHSLLKRQLRKYLSDQQVQELGGFLDAVDQAYLASDLDRKMLERSLDITSQELLLRNQDLTHLLDALPDLCLRLNKAGQIRGRHGNTASDLFWQALAINESFVEGLPSEKQIELLGLLSQFASDLQPLVSPFIVENGTEVLRYELQFLPLQDQQILLLIRNQTQEFLRQEELAFQNRKLLSFYLMAEVMMISASLHESYRRILKELLPLTQFDLIQIAHYDPNTDSLSHEASFPSQLDVSAQKVTGSYLEQSVRQGKTQLYSSADPLLCDASFIKNGYKTHLCIPLMRESTVIGLLSLFIQQKTVVSADFIQWMNSLANYLGHLIERKQVEIALHQSQQLAEAASYAKSQFLATMSHELRTPLNSILGFTHVLTKNQKLSSEDQLQYLDRIHHNGQHLLHIINDILNVSGLDQVQALHIESVSVNQVLKQVTQDYQSLVESKQIALQIELPLQEVVLATDAAHLSQIINNLLSNAIKFTPNEGQIWLRLKAPTNQSAWVEIEDTGIGIAASKQAKVFDAFYQVESSYARRFEGIGLGLTLCRVLCQRLGFSIELDSQPEFGSALRLILGAKT